MYEEKRGKKLGGGYIVGQFLSGHRLARGGSREINNSAVDVDE